MRLDEALLALAERGTPAGADRLIERLGRRMAGQPDLVVVAREQRRPGMQTTETKSIQRPPMRAPRRGWALGLAVFAVVLLVGAGFALWAILDRPGEPIDQPTTTQAPATTAAPTAVPPTTSAAPVVASPADLVAVLYAALNDHDADTLMALHSRNFQHHSVYYTDGISGGMTADFDATRMRGFLANPDFERVDVVGEPLVSGDVMAVPVRYTYADGPLVGFDLLVLDSSMNVLQGTTLLAEPEVTVDPETAQHLRDARLEAWNGQDLDGVLAMLTDDVEIWDLSGTAASRYTTRAEASDFIAGSLWITVEATGDGLVSGPFTATPTRVASRANIIDTSQGITIDEIREGRSALFLFAQGS